MPTYFHMNDKFVEGKMFYPVCRFSSLLYNINRWNITDRVRRTINGDILTEEWLKPKKHKYTPENTNVYKYKIVEVGTKDKTKGLPEGKIYQLFKID